MIIFLCGYNSEYYKKYIDISNDRNITIITDEGINIDYYEILNPDIIIYIYNIFDTSPKNIKYEIKFDTINCMFPIYKLNGIDDIPFNIKCLNDIIDSHKNKPINTNHHIIDCSYNYKLKCIYDYNYVINFSFSFSSFFSSSYTSSSTSSTSSTSFTSSTSSTPYTPSVYSIPSSRTSIYNYMYTSSSIFNNLFLLKIYNNRQKNAFYKTNNSYKNDPYTSYTSYKSYKPYKSYKSYKPCIYDIYDHFKTNNFFR